MRRLWPVVVLAVLLPACSDVSGGATPSPTASIDMTGCGPVEQVPIQGEGHLVGFQEPPVPYNSAPPTSGWHTSGEVPIEITPDGEPLTEPQQVTVLELGGVVVTFSQLPADDLDTLTALLEERFAGQAALTRYDKLPAGEIALTSWGVLQRCTELNAEAVAAFVTQHAQR